MQGVKSLLQAFSFILLNRQSVITNVIKVLYGFVSVTNLQTL